MIEPDPTPGSLPNAPGPRPGELNPPKTPADGGRTSNSGEALLPGATIARRFTLTRLIGRGGMGVVWEARDTSLGREVALKFLGNEVAADPEAVADLQRETRRSLELTHPNIVRIYDYVEDPQLRLVGISMELLSGRSLQMLKLEQPKRAFSPETVLPWLRQICAALDYAHHVVGVIHRDLKPGNLFLNDRGSLKIVDFGIAMVVRDSTSRLVQEARLSRSGTLAYMSHQQLKGDKPTPADDMYAVGALLYELFTSKPPFFRGEAHALMLQIMSQPPMAIAERQAELGVTDIIVPPMWEAAIMACLSKDASARPASGEALLAMIASGAPADQGDATMLISALPAGAVDPEKTMLVGAAALRLPPPLPPAPTPPKLPPPPAKPEGLPVLPARGEGAAVHVHTEPPKRNSGPWGWLGVLGDLLGLKSAVTAGMLLVATGLLSWCAKHGSPHALVLKVEPSDIGAFVSIDGRPSLPMPAEGSLQIHDLSDGEHSVSVDAKGFRRYEAGVAVSGGRGEHNVKLVALYGSVELIARPGTRYTAQPKGPGKVLTGEVGTSGRILLDRLRVGDVTFHLEHPLCQPTDLEPVSVFADQTQTLHPAQKTFPVTISFKSVPSGATILINGTSRGTTPKELADLPAETSLAIEARLEGHESARGNYSFNPGEHKELSFDLLQIHGTLIVAARPGTRVTARRSNQTMELGAVGSSGEETFAGVLPLGRWSIAFEQVDCQPASPVDVQIEQGKTARLSPKQVSWPGSLEIRSDPPGATVLINGATRGNTPTVVEKLPSETPLTVELRLRGRNSERRSVTLRPREQSSLTVDGFEAERFSVKVDLQPWEALRGKRINFSVDGVPVDPRSNNGSVFELPVENNALHNVQVEAEGYREHSMRFDGIPAEGKVVRVSLQPSPAGLLVRTDPIGARVWLNERGPVESPASFRDIPAGRYTLHIEKQGFRRVAQEVTVAAGEILTVGPISLEGTTNFDGGSSSPGAPVDIVPQDADRAGAVQLKGVMRTEQVINALRGVAEHRGWAISKIDNNVVVLTLKNHGHDATVYCRVNSTGVDFYSESYRAGVMALVNKSRQIPSGWIKNLQQDLAKVLGSR